MRFALVVALLMISSSAARADEWSRSDTALQATAGVLLAADYLQTKQIISAPVDERHRESNPLMSTHGGGLGMSPELYFLSVAGTHTLVAVALPRPWRRVAQVGLIALQTWTVSSNWSAGYSLSF